MSFSLETEFDFDEDTARYIRSEARKRLALFVIPVAPFSISTSKLLRLIENLSTCRNQNSIEVDVLKREYLYAGGNSRGGDVTDVAIRRHLKMRYAIAAETQSQLFKEINRLRANYDKAVADGLTQYSEKAE